MTILNAAVHGGVQGVGFRDFVQRRAREAGITGWVRNRSDGSVELHAVGSRPALERLLEQLRRGPGLAMVERVEPHWSDVGEDEGTGFQIHA
ncbi:MAG TPA: acylphosphatase [Candidatus Dormibacteraeota bacterium]|nr:acylphosphatase [Candidatus Dormibacteraeota bacterium]